MNTTRAEEATVFFIPGPNPTTALTNGRIPQWEVRAELNE